MVGPYSQSAEPATGHDWINQWFTDYHVLIVRYIERIIGNPEHAADILQETFLRAFKVLNPAQLPSNPQAWLCRIASNLAIDHLRRQQRWSWFVSQWKPAQQAMEQEVVNAQVIRRCMVSLKAADAEVLLLTHYIGYSTAEVAALTGEDTGTVRKRLCRARERFRILYEKEVSP